MTFKYSKKRAVKARLADMSNAPTDAQRLAAQRQTVTDLEKLKERLTSELQGKPGAVDAIAGIDTQIALHISEIAKLEAGIVADKHGTR